jgi:hypothetical protein
MKNTSFLSGWIAVVWTLVLATVAPLNSQTFINNGLVAFYPFNGNANDASGNGNNGTASNVAFVADRFGAASSAGSFNGTSSSLVTLNTTSLNLTPPFTVSAWVRFSSVVSGRILSTAGYELNINSGLAAIDMTSASGAGTNTTSKQQLANGVWHHVVGVWTSDGGVLFTNGVVASTYATGLTISYSRGFVPKIGRNSGSTADSFPGLIDDLRVYHTAFSAADVAQLFQYESGLRVDLVKAVKPTFSNLTIGKNYQLQLSSDLTTWTDQGTPFSPTGSSMAYPQYWDVDNWNELFFRLQVVP